MFVDTDAINRANEQAVILNRDTRLIPHGSYCYTLTSGLKVRADGTPYLESATCPYWALDPTKPPQQNGYCAFTRHGDWDAQGVGLLWDQCKECGINDDIDE